MLPEDELKDFPYLKQLQGNQSFKAPEGYFETLGSSIADRINSNNTQPVVKFKLKPIFIISFLILTIISGYIIFNNSNDKKELATNTVMEISTDDLIESDYYTEIDENLIAETFNNTKTTADLDADIEEYLINNHIEESTILNSF